MFPPGEGPSPRVIPAAAPVAPPPTASPTPGNAASSNSAASDMADIIAAKRAAAMQRLLDAQIQRQQRELAEQQAQAADAKRHAQDAARASWEAEEAAKRATTAEDKARTRADADRKAAELDSAAADWQVKEKKAKLTEAELADAREQQKDPLSTRTRPTQAAVTKAEGELKDANDVKDILDTRLDVLNKNAAAEKAEAAAPPKNASMPLSPQQIEARDNATRLRAEANDAQAQLNRKMVAWDVKQKKAAIDDARAQVAEDHRRNPHVPLQDLQQPEIDASAAYDDALKRQKVVDAAADAAHKQLLAVQADDKVAKAQQDVIAEQKQLGMCVAKSPASDAFTQASNAAKQAHNTADTATANAEKEMVNYQIGVKTQALDAAKADLQVQTGGRAGPYVPGTPAGDAAAKVTQLQNEIQQLRSGQTSAQTNLANAQSQQLFATLAPGQEKDPKALWKLFSEGDNATTIAQPMLNQYYQQYGDTAHEMSGTYLDNIIGMTLGLKSSVDLSKINDPAQRDQVLHQQALYTKSDDLDRIKKVRDKLGDAAGEVGSDKGKPRVALLPVTWGSKDVGMTTSTLYRVDGPNGERFVDDQGKVYKDWHDYRYNNGLPPTDSKIVLAKDGHLRVDGNGNVITETGKASFESGWDKFKREWHVDAVVAGATIVGGLLVDAAGIITMPIGVGAALEVGGTAMIVGGSAYFAYEAGSDIVERSEHEQSINPFTNSEARMDWLMLGSSVLTGGAVGADLKLGLAARAASRAETVGGDAANLAARSGTGLQRAKTVMGTTGGAMGLWQFGEQGYDLVKNWSSMTDAQRSDALKQMGSGVAMMAANPVMRGGLRALASRGGRVPMPVGARAPGETVEPKGVAAPKDMLAEVAGKSGDLALGAARERGAFPELDLPVEHPAAPAAKAPSEPATVSSKAGATKPASLDDPRTVDPLASFRETALGHAEPSPLLFHEQVGLPAMEEDSGGLSAMRKKFLSRQGLKEFGDAVSSTPRVKRHNTSSWITGRVKPQDYARLHVPVREIRSQHSIDGPAVPKTAQRAAAMHEWLEANPEATSLDMATMDELVGSSGSVKVGWNGGDRFITLDGVGRVEAIKSALGDYQATHGVEHPLQQVEVYGVRLTPREYKQLYKTSTYFRDEHGVQRENYQHDLVPFTAVPRFVVGTGMNVAKKALAPLWQKFPFAEVPDRRIPIDLPRHGGDVGGMDSQGAWRMSYGEAHPLAESVNPTGSTTNCVNCAVTLDRMLGAPGVEMQAVPSAPKTIGDVEALYRDKPAFEFNNADEAKGYLQSLPPGSRGFVIVSGGARSHIVNFVRGEHGADLIDAQAGRTVNDFEAPHTYVMVTHEGGVGEGAAMADSAALSGAGPRSLAGPADASSGGDFSYTVKQLPADLVPDERGVYGYLPTEDSQFHSSKWPVDWTDAEQVGNARQVRLGYHQGLADEKTWVAQMRERGVPDDQIARELVDMRNKTRMSKYSEDKLPVLFARNAEKYGNPYGPTYESLLDKYGSPQGVIDAGTRSNPTMDILTGIGKVEQ